MVLQDEQKVSELPSRKMYKKFEDDTGHTECDATQQIASTWASYPYISPHEDKIKHGLCYVSQMKVKNELYLKPCTFLFYWIVDIITNGEPPNSDFPGVTTQVHKLLQQFNSEWECKNIYQGISKDLFENSKILFDFLQDNRAIQTALSKSNYNCSEGYKDYRQKLEGAYNNMSSTCPIDSEDQCCKDFNGMNKNLVQVGISNFICSEVSKPESGHVQVQTSHDIHSAPKIGGNSNPTTIISSILATTVGLPASIAFFLYKYNLLPSWLHNKLGGGNRRGRRGRSTGPNFDDDTLTTTDSSTIGGSTTTDDYYSTSDSTDTSTIYNGPSNRRRTGRTGRTNTVPNRRTNILCARRKG
ncbi:KIR-like CYIR protein [Plasmodium coatneyi]|uniref:KIR-like CYIR protein n=1 Tax=Plasmodium coatneyi TaxID=208452 RepID=A0A1B1DWZ8_9APIC|nr:KIR-like CYIR protein [Plasmodium coatneyi]ANQ07313.1 KIR-like CYIR protein [Plasmodium coatneyi]